MSEAEISKLALHNNWITFSKIIMMIKRDHLAVHR